MHFLSLSIRFSSEISFSCSSSKVRICVRELHNSTTTVSGWTAEITYKTTTVQSADNKNKDNAKRHITNFKGVFTFRTSSQLSLLKCAVPTKYTFSPFEPSNSDTVLGNCKSSVSWRFLNICLTKAACFM